MIKMNKKSFFHLRHKKSICHLEAYPLMRFYSVHSSLGVDLDYCSFSLFRLAAYGGAGMTEDLATKKLSSQSISLGRDIGYTEAIQLINSFRF